MPDPSPSTLTVLNSKFLQLGRRSGGRPERTVHPRRLPVNCDTHYVSRHRTHNLPIVSPTRYQYRATETTTSFNVYYRCVFEIYFENIAIEVTKSYKSSIGHRGEETLHSRLLKDKKSLVPSAHSEIT